MIELLKIVYKSGKINIDVNIILIISILIGIFLIYRFYKKKSFKKANFLNLVELEFNFGSSKTRFKVIRNSENLYIANRICIELLTRKASLEVDFEHDVISEIYDSWYILFSNIRNEIKNIPGEYLENKSDSSKELMELTIKILNEGLRPHLTKYQAEFRKWFKKAQEEYPNESPQNIQKKYYKFKELAEDMRQVNSILINYAEQLNKFIYNE